MEMDRGVDGRKAKNVKLGAAARTNPTEECAVERGRNRFFRVSSGSTPARNGTPMPRWRDRRFLIELE